MQLTAWVESACRILGIFAMLLGAPKVFHTYYAILGIMSTSCEVCHCTLCLHSGYESLCVPNTTLCIKLDLIGSYEGHFYTSIPSIEISFLTWE